VETKGKVASLRDKLASNGTMLRLNGLDLSVPTLISHGEQHDIMKWVVERMEMTDKFVAAVFIAQDYISVIIHILFSSAWNYGGHLINTGQVVPTTISPLLQDYGHLEVRLGLCGAFTHDLISLLI
jgi:hypothetical protein